MKLKLTKTDCEFIRNNYLKLSKKKLASKIGTSEYYISLFLKSENLSKAFTEEEDNILKNFSKKLSLNLLQEKLPHRRKGQIKNRIKELGLLTTKSLPWSKEEDSKLTTHYASSISEISHLFPNRTSSAISARVQFLGLSKKKGDIVWSEEEKKILINNASTFTWVEISNTLLPNRTAKAIQAKASKMGLTEISSELWSVEEIETLKALGRSMSITEVASHFPNRTRSSVRQKLSTLGLYREYNPLWSEDELQVLKDMYSTKDSSIILEALNYSKSWTQITLRANRLGLDRSSIEERKYYVNDSFFSELSPLSCYYAGMLASDGCVHKDNSISLTFKRSDKYMLEQFRKDLDSNYKIYDGETFLDINNVEAKKRYYKSTFCFNSYRIQEDLKSIFNITPRKSKTLEPPNLTNPYSFYFILGLIDGDGSIFFRKGHRYPDINIYGTKGLLDWVKSVLDKISLPKNGSKVRPSGSIYSHEITGLRALSFIIFTRSLGLSLMKRKWNSSQLDSCIDSFGKKAITKYPISL